MKLSGKVAVITGAGRGIGRTIALAYAGEGANIVAAARNADDVAETAWLAEELGQKALSVPMDVRHSEQVERLVDQTNATFGAAHIVVNSAGVGLRMPLQETNEQMWDTVVETLLKGTYLVTKAFLPQLIEQGHGNIINIGAPLERIAVPGFAAYCSAKYGVEGFSRVLAKELRRHGVNVNVLHPGVFVDTQMVRETIPEAKGLAAPDIITAAAVVLAAQEPRGQTGKVIDAQQWQQEQ